jgi:hypothetical protein
MHIPSGTFDLRNELLLKAAGQLRLTQDLAFHRALKIVF